MADRLFTGTRKAIVSINGLSRNVGFNTVINELESLGISSDLDESELANFSLLDWVNARPVASRFSTEWLAYANKFGSIQAANALSLSKLQTIAATQSSKSFNEGKNAAADQIDPDFDKTLIKIWDSTLDSNTCPVCAGADGDMVYIHERFTNGEPGAVHPNCRCTYHIQTEAEVIFSDKAA